MRDVIQNIISVVVALLTAAVVVICVGTSDGSLTDKATMFSAIGAMLFLRLWYPSLSAYLKCLSLQA